MFARGVRAALLLSLEDVCRKVPGLSRARLSRFELGEAKLTGPERRKLRSALASLALLAGNRNPARPKGELACR